MGISDFFAKLFAKEKDEYQEVIDERNKIKENISNNFKTQLGFTNLEVKELLDLVTLAEAEIEEIKRGLANVNINNPNTEIDVENAVKKINQVSQQMYEDIKTKAAIIMQRKKEFNANKNDRD